MRAAVSEQVLGVALLVVQRTQQHTGPPQLSRSDAGTCVRGVGILFSGQEQNLTSLTEFLLMQWEGGKCSEPGGSTAKKNILMFYMKNLKLVIWHYTVMLLYENIQVLLL